MSHFDERRDEISDEKKYERSDERRDNYEV
jgi:hypothetical protein